MRRSARSVALDERTRRQMQEARDFLNSQEAQEARDFLNSREAQEARKHLFSKEARDILAHLRSSAGQAQMNELQRPETRRFLEQISRPEHRRFYEETMRYAREAGAGRVDRDLAGFSLPVRIPFGTPIGVGADTVRAATEVASLTQARAFRAGAAELASLARISLPSEVGSVAQVATARRFLAPSAQETMSAASRASLDQIRMEFAETLTRASDLFSDPNLRRMVESANAEELILAEGLEATEEDPLEGVEGGLAAEEIDILLGPDGDVELLLPWVNWAFILFGIAWIVATGYPSFVEYKEPLEKVLTKLGLLSKALEMFLKDREG